MQAPWLGLGLGLGLATCYLVTTPTQVARHRLLPHRAMRYLVTTPTQVARVTGSFHIAPASKATGSTLTPNPNPNPNPKP